MPFSNINITYGNFCFGPVAGRIHTIDHVTDTMITKTYPGGTLVSTLPLNVGIQNEVLHIEYDGYYFWTLSRLGATGTLGLLINKWLIVGGNLVKQVGPTNEVNLINSGSITYDSEAFSVHKFESSLASFASVGATSITMVDNTFLQIGDSIYLGPSTASAGEREERKVTSISGNIVGFTLPLVFQYNITNKVTYRKNIWVFNNFNGTSSIGAMLLQIDSYTCLQVSNYSSCEWKYVTSATSYGGDLHYTRGAQLLRYRPLGPNAGYQNSSLLLNTKNDNNTIIKISGLQVDSTTVYKLQKEQHVYNTITHLYEDTIGLNNNFHVDTELTTPKVQSITAIRNKSVFFGVLDVADFTVKVTDQYDIPVLGRSVTVTDNDLSGLIPAGFTAFTTNAKGAGVTRYNTGASTDFSTPIITVRDVGTDLRLNMLLEQFKNSNNRTEITQFKLSNVPTQIEQVNVDSRFTVEQYGILQTKTETVQVRVQGVKTQVVQDITTSPLVMEQLPKPSNSTPLVQEGLLQEPTTLEQYNFLLFAIPLPYSKKNAINSSILVRIIGFGASPLNAYTLVFKVNGVDISPYVVVTPFGGGLQLDYDPPVDFPYSSTVSIYIEIQDTNLPPRTISTSYTFDIVGDFKTPFLQSVFPPDNSVDNLPDTVVYARIGDLETGIDLTSIEMYLGGKKVNTVNTLVGPGVIQATHTTSTNFPFKSNISAAIRCKDLEGNEFIGTWNFSIRSSSGVLFINNSPEQCSVLVPIDTDVCMEVFGLEEGVNLDSLSFDINQKKVTYVLNPKVYRKE